MEYVPELYRRYGFTQEPYGLALHELDQAAQTGHDVTLLRARFEATDRADDAVLSWIYQATLAQPRSAESAFFEASSFDAIRGQLPEPQPPRRVDSTYPDRVRGAWFGRVVGNMVGKPVEGGASRADLRAYLLAHDAYPLRGYVPFDPVADETLIAEPWQLGDVFGPAGPIGTTDGTVDGSVRDDDIDWTVLGLHLVETYGCALTTADVAREWLNRLPIYQTGTAERAAYSNLLREIPLDQVGEFQNPFREWIGAQIRADIFGYVHPGDPRAAALASWPDAFLSHRSNGIYGEMWAAGLIASAFAAAEPQESVLAALAQVPSRSRIAAEVTAVLDDWRSGRDWEHAMDQVQARHPDIPTTSVVHVLHNTGALTAAILYGAGDFAATVGYAVQAALDTDSIGATAGSWAGAFVGYDALPERLVRPIRDHVRTAVFGFGDLPISSLVERTLRAEQNLRRSSDSINQE